MSRNRCPLCGANHKSDAERCRLCGQSLAPGALGLNNKQVVQPVRTARGTKGMLLVGIGLVLAVLVVALAFGVVQANSQLRKAKDLVVGEADGWTTQVDERGVFSVDLPGDRRPVTTDYPGADDGKLSGWEAVVGNDTDLVVGWGPASPPLTNGTIDRGPALRYLRETIVPRWATGKQVTENDYQVEEGGVAGYPAVRVRSTGPVLKWNNLDLYSQVSFVLVKNRVYMLIMATIYRDAPQLDRMVSSFQITGPIP